MWLILHESLLFFFIRLIMTYTIISEIKVISSFVILSYFYCYSYINKALGREYPEPKGTKKSPLRAHILLFPGVATTCYFNFSSIVEIAPRLV